MLNEIARRYGRVEDGTVRVIWRLMADLQASVNQEVLAALSPGSLLGPESQAAMRGYLERFNIEAEREIREGIQLSIQAGVDSFAQPLISLGYALDARPDPALLNTLTGFSADLVQNVTEDCRKVINMQVRMTALAQVKPFDAMKEITRQFGLQSMRLGREVVSGVGYRAERILRTELMRTFNLTHYAKQIESAPMIPGLMKGWLATADSRTRRTHLQAHMQYQANPIPVDEPFVVGGSELMYPGDPAGRPEDTINCRCRSYTVVPEVGVLSTPLDARIKQQLEGE